MKPSKVALNRQYWMDEPDEHVEKAVAAGNRRLVTRVLQDLSVEFAAAGKKSPAAILVSGEEWEFEARVDFAAVVSEWLDHADYDWAYFHPEDLAQVADTMLEISERIRAKAAEIAKLWANPPPAPTRPPLPPEQIAAIEERQRTRQLEILQGLADRRGMTLDEYRADLRTRTGG